MTYQATDGSDILSSSSVYRPLVVTARMDDESQVYFDGLRKAHFPPARNFLRAHVTLFHALPGDRAGEVAEILRRVAAGAAAPSGRVWRVRSLGRGVAFDVECPALAMVRETLREGFGWGLTKQDAQRSWRPHITVQNKVEPEVARALLAELSGSFVERRIEFAGLTLWEYLGGPWELVGEFPFAVACLSP